jgi:predicted HNH restriction endonuclease
MAFPKWTDIDEPLLCLIYLSGGSEYQMKAGNTYEPLAKHFELSAKDRAKGRRFKDKRFEYHWHNMVQYARWRLIKAAYLEENAPRGIWRLTEEGKDAAKKIVNGYSFLVSSEGVGSEQQAELPDIDFSVREGGKKWVIHLRRERKPRIVRAKKRRVLKETGKLQCEVCDFDFEEKYHALGKHFCETHHKKPIGTAQYEVETKLKDLAIICSNCHRMIHKTKPMMTIEQFRGFVKSEA